MKYPGIKETTDIQKLDEYVQMIYESNIKFNLTGFQKISDIEDFLVRKSLEPFSAIDVPRGTSIADLGTGSGIPGIPVSIRFSGSEITMFDATAKKIEFVKSAVSILKIENARAVCGRIEDLAKNNDYREKFDWVLSRAMADLFTALELGAPFVKMEGYFYLYASEKQINLTDIIREHIEKLGLRELSIKDKFNVMQNNIPGLLLKKIKRTNIIYPRRFSCIKRNSLRFS